MTVKFEVLGPENSVLYYHLNKQFCNVNKVVITSQTILNALEKNEIIEIIENLQNAPSENFQTYLQDAKERDIFSKGFKDEFYKVIQEHIQKISGDMDINLKDYNFMSSVSNTKFTITLRCESFTISNEYIEKGAILTSMRNLLEKYLFCSVNPIRKDRLKNFQIEISVSSETHKKIYLKKEGTSLLLYAGFGFQRNEPINYISGGELYCCKDDDFAFFENKQQNAIIREHGKLVEEEIHHKEKIISHDELVNIHKQTKDIEDALIELEISNKGNLRIVHVSVLESSCGPYSKDTAIFHKSSKNYTKLALLSLREDFDGTSPNPEYALIRSDGELKEFLNSLDICEKIDGIVLTYPFYSPLLDIIGEQKDMDIIYSTKHLQKTLETTFNHNEITFDIGENSFSENPFGNLLEKEKRKPDEMLERLKNIDLSTPSPQHKEEDKPSQRPDANHINSIAQSIISSPDSSTKRSGGISWGNTPSKGSKKSAIDLLADKALGREEPTPEPVNSEENIDLHSSNLVMKDITSADLTPLSDEQANESIQKAMNHETLFSAAEISEKYENIIGTRLLTLPNVPSKNYFTDSSSMPQSHDIERLFVTVSTPEQITSQNAKHILPISYAQSHKNKYYLITTLQDYFKIPENRANHFFVNLSYIETSLRPQFLEALKEKLSSFSLIIHKEDLELLENTIGFLRYVVIKDITSIEEFERYKINIAEIEKRALLKLSNN